MKNVKLANGKGLWIGSGDWFPTYVRDQQTQAGQEFQHYLFGAKGEALCGGVTRHESMNRANARQVVRVWERWRKEHIAQNPGRYPLAGDFLAPVARIVTFPIDRPTERQVYEM